MVAEAVGFMSRAVDGGMAAELVTRDFLGGCTAADDARDAANVVVRASRLSVSVSLRVFTPLLNFFSYAQLGLAIGLMSLNFSS